MHKNRYNKVSHKTIGEQLIKYTANKRQKKNCHNKCVYSRIK